MARRDAIDRDGLATGRQAPSWTLRDSHGAADAGSGSSRYRSL
jgi:hypothetical protein